MPTSRLSPTSIKSYLDGRWDSWRALSSRFRQAWSRTWCRSSPTRISGEVPAAESVQNVRKTNGRISLEQRVRGAWGEDDEWQD